MGADEKGRTLALVQLSIRNCGTAPSIAHRFTVEVRTSGGDVISFRQILQKEVPIPNSKFLLRHENAIYERARTPIPVGGIVDGHLCCLTDRVLAKSDIVGSTTTVSFVDAHDRPYSSSFTLEELAKPLYYPGMHVADD